MSSTLQALIKQQSYRVLFLCFPPAPEEREEAASWPAPGLAQAGEGLALPAKPGSDLTRVGG